MCVAKVLCGCHVCCCSVMLVSVHLVTVDVSVTPLLTLFIVELKFVCTHSVTMS